MLCLVIYDYNFSQLNNDKPVSWELNSADRFCIPSDGIVSRENPMSRPSQIFSAVFPLVFFNSGVLYVFLRNVSRESDSFFLAKTVL